MKKIFVLIGLFVSLTSIGQGVVYSNPQPSLPGIKYQRVKSDSVQPIPRRTVHTDRDTTPGLYVFNSVLWQRINGVSSIVGGSVANYDTAYARRLQSLGFTGGILTATLGSGQRIEVSLDDRYNKISDTAAMLSNRLKISDTTFMLSGYARIGVSGITIGSTTILLGGTSATLDGLTSVTSTDFAGNITGAIGKFWNGSGGFFIRDQVGGAGINGALYPTTVTPSSTNYILSASSTSTLINAATSVIFQIGASSVGTLNSTGITYTGSVTGGAASFTTGGFSGAITSTLTANGIFVNTVSSTSRKYIEITNDGTQFYAGAGGSTANSIFTGQASYSVLVGSGNATSLQLGTNAIVRYTIDASGNNIWTGSLTGGAASFTTGTFSGAGSFFGLEPIVTDNNTSNASYILHKYSGTVRAISGYNGGNATYGGETGTGVVLTANGSVALTITTALASTFVSSVTATSFVKSGSSDSYVLLGGGGQALLSSISGTTQAISSVKTSAYSVTASDYTVLGNSSGGSFTITLPTAVGITGRIYRFTRTDIAFSGGNLIIAAAGSETIGGYATYSFGNQTVQASITIQSDGTNWIMIGR